MSALPRDLCSRKVLPYEIPAGRHVTFDILARCFAHIPLHHVGFFFA
jgi:hypothetical protein